MPPAIATEPAPASEVATVEEANTADKPKQEPATDDAEQLAKSQATGPGDEGARIQLRPGMTAEVICYRPRSAVRDFSVDAAVTARYDRRGKE